jgi:hypothetical protein
LTGADSWRKLGASSGHGGDADQRRDVMPGSHQLTVLLPVWNEGSRALAAVRSVVDQSYGDFEVLVLSDGAGEDVLGPIRALSDARVRVLSFPHRGLARTLVDGAARARGEFIARMDADDLCRPTRFAAQISWLRAHPQCGVVGTAYQVVTDDLVPLYTYHPPRTHSAILRTLRLGENPICHGSVVMRRAAYERAGGYRVDLPYAEDFGLWLRMARVARLAALDDVLYTRRLRVGSICRQFTHEVSRCRTRALAADGDGAAADAPATPDAVGGAASDHARRQRQALASYHHECGYFLVHARRYREAARHLWTAQRTARTRSGRLGALLAAAVLGSVVPEAVDWLLARKGGGTATRVRPTVVRAAAR